MLLLLLLLLMEALNNIDQSQPKKSLKSLHIKLVPILPSVSATSFPGSLSLRRDGYERTLGTRLQFLKWGIFQV